MPKFLFKANDAVISHCRCTIARRPCRPASSTARGAVRLVDLVLVMQESPIRMPWCARSTRHWTNSPAASAQSGELEDYVDEQGITDWIEFMTAELEPFDEGQIVVYLDGATSPSMPKTSHSPESMRSTNSRCCRTSRHWPSRPCSIASSAIPRTGGSANVRIEARRLRRALPRTLP